MLLSLLIAAFWGAVHALTPGHGKALVAGYLVGTKGRPRDAVLLGATVTVTHTAGVFALGLVTLLLSQFIVPDTLYPWLTLVSGLLVVGVGLSVLLQRLRRGGWHDHHHDDGDHDHGHAHRSRPRPGTTDITITTTSAAGCDELGVLQMQGGAAVLAGAVPSVPRRRRRHDDERDLTRDPRGRRRGGHPPCPSALVVLSARSRSTGRLRDRADPRVQPRAGRDDHGIGLVAVLARRVFSRVSFEGRLVRLLPAISALVILCVGLVHHGQGDSRVF